jgi:putative transposase
VLRVNNPDLLEDHMQGKRYPEEKIIAVLNEAEAGAKVADLCRKHGISDVTFYGWRKKYKGLQLTEAKKLRKLEDENSRLKRIIANQAIDLEMLKEVVSKKW